MSSFAEFLSFTIMLLGLGLMLAEALIFCYGLFAVSGLLFFCFSLVLFVKTGLISHEIAWSIGMGASLANFGLIVLAGYFAWRAHAKRQVSGIADMLGQTAEVLECLPNQQAWVRLAGERWKALSSEELYTGQTVQVLGVEGLILKVKSL